MAGPESRELRLERAGEARERTVARAPTLELLAERWREAGGSELCRERATADGGLVGCLACGHPELYTQRDFPRPLGFAIVAAAALAAPATSYVSLFVAGLLDAVLYRFAPDVIVCYVCRARHAGFAPRPRHPAFDREIAERLRYGPKAVMGRAMRPGGTADAPDPEH